MYQIDRDKNQINKIGKKTFHKTLKRWKNVCEICNYNGFRFIT